MSILHEQHSFFSTINLFAVFWLPLIQFLNLFDVKISIALSWMLECALRLCARICMSSNGYTRWELMEHLPMEEQNTSRESVRKLRNSIRCRISTERSNMHTRIFILFEWGGATRLQNKTHVQTHTFIHMEKWQGYSGILHSNFVHTVMCKRTCVPVHCRKFTTAMKCEIVCGAQIIATVGELTMVKICGEEENTADCRQKTTTTTDEWFMNLLCANCV